MACSCCAFGDTADQHFTAQKVAKELGRYRQKGLGPTTRRLCDGFATTGLSQGTVLDIGGGLGVLALELLDSGMSGAVVVDASSAYLAAASDEAARRGRSASVQLVHGDFLELADELPASTVVALDRVVCCYPYYEPLLEQALRHAEQAFAISYPRERWYVNLGMWFENAMRRRSGNPFRTFVHPVARMEQIVTGAGFDRVSHRCTLAWCSDIFVRRAGSPPRVEASYEPTRSSRFDGNEAVS